MNRIVHKINFHEFFRLARFGIVGIAATIVHLSTVYLILENSSVNVIFSNGIGFATAFIVSFTGHYYWTFRSDRAVASAIKRFFLVSFGGFIANSICLEFLISSAFFSQFTSVFVSIFVIPIATFLLGKIWVF